MPRGVIKLHCIGFQHVRGDRRLKRLEIINYNREANYAQLHRSPDSQGQVLYIHHELMVSRFTPCSSWPAGIPK